MKKYLVGDIGVGGFGAIFSRRKLIMQIAEAFNREPVFRFTNYVYEDPFEPLPYTLNDLKQQGINEVKKFTFTDTDELAVYFDFDNYWESNYRDVYQCWSPNNENYLFYTGKLYNSLNIKQQYAIEIDRRLDQIKKDWNIQRFKDILGLHFRKGDKINESLYMSEDYVASFIKTNFDIKLHKVFITSDDLGCILSMINKYPEINFIYDKTEKRYGIPSLSNMQLVINNPELKHEETITFMKNVEILKQCSCVMGCYNTQLTKISGCINSYLNNEDRVYLLNPYTSVLEKMGNSLHTS
jgi:hypothetical protein